MVASCINPCDPPYNCVGDGLTDDTIGFQNAINVATNQSSSVRSIFLPGNKVFRLTSTIIIGNSIRIYGEGVAPYEMVANGATRGGGSWLYLDHSGVGLYCEANGGIKAISGLQLQSFGTFRNQPAASTTPGTSWTPYNHDWDIVLSCISADLEDLMLLNATKGIACINGNYGRLTANRISGQFFKVGLCLDKQYDVAMIDQFRNWSFWNDNVNVHAYTVQNCDAIYLLRVDNPIMSNIFSIRHKAGLRIGQSNDEPNYPGGTVSKLKIANADFDVGKYGIWVDSSVVSACQVFGSNISAQGDNIDGSNAILAEGQNSDISLLNIDFRFFNQNAVRNSGSGTLVSLGGRIYIAGTDGGNTGFPALEAMQYSTICCDTMPDISMSGAGPKYGGSGHIFTPEWRDWSPSISSSNGNINTSVVNLAKFRQTRSKTDINAQITITDNGSGSGQLLLSLPQPSIGVVALNGYLAAGPIGGQVFGGAGNGLIAQVLRYDNSYPVQTGTVIRLTGSYMS